LAGAEEGRNFRQIFNDWDDVFMQQAQLHDVGGIERVWSLEAVANHHAVGRKQAALDHQFGDVHVDGGGHFVVRPSAERGADHFFGGVGFGGVGVMKLAAIVQLGDDVGKDLVHLMDLMADERQVDDF
jgi:hypothetical protein